MALTLNDIKAIRIKLASPEVIRKLSFGEVKKPETINYKTLKPERDGLFCERIFGPVKDYECACGKYKRSKSVSLLLRTKQKGFRCERCGVEITRSKVRRERLGHIELAAPVVHVWYYKGNPSIISLFLNLPQSELEKVVSFQAWIATEVNEFNRELMLQLLKVVYFNIRENLRGVWSEIRDELSLMRERLLKLLSEGLSDSDLKFANVMRDIIDRLLGTDERGGVVDELFDGISSSIRTIKAREIESKYSDFHLEMVSKLRSLEALSPTKEELKALWDGFYKLVRKMIETLLVTDTGGVSLQKVDEVYVYFRDSLNDLRYKKVISETDHSQMERLEKEYREKLSVLSFLLSLSDRDIRDNFSSELAHYLLELKRDLVLLITLNRLDGKVIRTLLDTIGKIEEAKHRAERVKRELADIEERLKDDKLTDDTRNELLSRLEELRATLVDLNTEVENRWFDYRNLVESFIFSQDRGILSKYNLLDYISMFFVDTQDEEAYEEYKRRFSEKLRDVLMELASLSSESYQEKTNVIRAGAQEMELTEEALSKRFRGMTVRDDVLERYLVSRFLKYNTDWSSIKDKYIEASRELKKMYDDFRRNYPEFSRIAVFMTGAEAIKKLLEDVDVDKLYRELRERMDLLLEWEVVQRRLSNRDIVLALITYRNYLKPRQDAITELKEHVLSLNDNVLAKYLSDLEALNLSSVVTGTNWKVNLEISDIYTEFREAVEEKVEDHDKRRAIISILKKLEDIDLNYISLLETFERLGTKGAVISNSKYQQAFQLTYDLVPEYSSLLFQLYLNANAEKLNLDLPEEMYPLYEMRRTLLKAILITRTNRPKLEELGSAINAYLNSDGESKEIAYEKLLRELVHLKLASYPEAEIEFLNDEYPLAILLTGELKAEWSDENLKLLKEIIDEMLALGPEEYDELYGKLAEDLWKMATTFIRESEGRREDILKSRYSDIWDELLKLLPGILDPLAGEFQIARTHNITTRNKLIKRLEVVSAFKSSGVKPSWMVLEVIPVLPPELRPIVPLEGGKFASSDLNDLYRRIINRNLRLKRLYDLDAPKMIINNEKRMLQESVDALIDNSKKAKPVVSQGSSKRLLKSLSDNLRGKQGRFRHNLLGKRVDYSGRAVIVVNPTLKMHQCGVPKEMALELFKPFLIRKLQERIPDMTIKRAKRMVEQGKPEVWDLLEEVIQNHPVLLNRAPTLHRLSIQAFEPVLVDGKAIQIHPLVCTPYNADFDGDQMAIHVPLTPEAQTESRVLMLSIHNMLIPANGQPANSPTQDMVIGAYYLTIELEPFSPDKVKKYFYSLDEALRAFEEGVVDVHDWVGIAVTPDLKVRTSPKEEPKPIKDGILYTTIGRCIFNEALRKHVVKFDPGFEFFNFEFDKKNLKWLVQLLIYRYGMVKAAPVLDEVKDLGFHWATKQGLTMSVADLVVPEEKREILDRAEREIEEYEKYYKLGLLSREKLDDIKIEVWQRTTDEVVTALKRYFTEKAKLNPVWMMANSGARGSMSQVKQLSGMRGLMVDPTGKIIPTPVKASFKEGLSVIEYFISTHGARKGLVDTALRTADSGYLTRRMVDVLQDVYVKEEDCGTKEGIVVRALKEVNWDPEDAEKLKVKDAFGRILAEDVVKGDELILKANTILDWFSIKKLEKARVREVLVYSETEVIPFSQRIRGRVSLQDFVNPGTGEVIVKEGELITLEKAEKIAKYYVEGKVRSVLKCKSYKGVCRKCYGEDLARGNVLIDLGEAVGIIAAQSIGEPGTQLTLRTFHTGGVAMEDIIQGLPKVEYLFEARKPRTTAPFLPEEAVLENVQTTDKGYKLEFKGEVFGDTYEVVIPFNQKPTLKISSYLRSKKKDIKKKVPAWVPLTRGLPSIKEVLERGISFLWEKLVSNVSPDGDGKVLRDLLASGELPLNIYSEKIRKLWEELKDEREIVRRAQEEMRRLIEDYVIEVIQKYIVDEIQKVYVSQGVSIHDKHVELIVRQMSRFARIIDPGDTELHPNKLIDYIALEKLNEELEKQGKRKVVAQRVLLGITKAALNTESFLSAASFQETTKVLTYAAIQGQVDPLNGLKENVIIGKLIPTGSGFWKYRDLKIRIKNKV